MNEGKSLTFAVVDDELVFRSSQKSILEENGFDVKSYASMASFLDAIEGGRVSYDYVLVDRFFDAENLDSIKEKIGFLIHQALIMLVMRE